MHNPNASGVDAGVEEVSFAASVLLSPDIALNVVMQLAHRTRGWCCELATVAQVSSTWRSALAEASTQIAAWHEFHWEVKGLGAASRSEVLLRLSPSRASGPYDWQLLLSTKGKLDADQLGICTSCRPEPVPSI